MDSGRAQVLLQPPPPPAADQGGLLPSDARILYLVLQRRSSDNVHVTLREERAPQQAQPQAVYYADNAPQGANAALVDHNVTVCVYALPLSKHTGRKRQQCACACIRGQVRDERARNAHSTHTTAPA
eukprot:TRINITY_DN1774_c0_g1_i1.p7 TRINITY_DN1774_c0_g1~~TRINITY_DN1774_c0_g1_i1.p7  ORF type:complete len:127 (+),score=23.10 TRINITY_DN1774_c0_g1_i1:2516-2896(+)